MAKTKKRKEMLKQSKALRKARDRVTKSIKKEVDNLFNALAQSVKDTDDSIIIKYTPFRTGLSRVIKKTHTQTVKNIINVIDDLYGIKKIKEFKTIEDRVLKDFNKKEAAKTVTRVTNVTKDKINKIITDRQTSGIGNKQIAKEIRDNIKGMTKNRSLTIARTETAKASGYSTNKLAKETLVNKKVWLHTGGGRTDRPEHAIIDGEEVDIDKPFSNGLMYAHEQGASAKEVINCYCVTTYRFKLQEGGKDG